MTTADQSRFNLGLSDSYDATDLATDNSEEGFVEAFLELTPDEQEFASEFVNFLASGRFSNAASTATAPRQPR
jgi:hypothetical protein